jgi:hypothetical protein
MKVRRSRLVIWIVVGLAFVAAVAIAFAQEAFVMRGPVRVESLTISPVIAADGTFSAFTVLATYHVVESVPSGVTSSSKIGSIQYDLSRSAASVMVGDTLYDDKEIADALHASAMHQWKLIHPDPLPVRRRALRP